MKVTHKSTKTFTNVIIDTDHILSNVNTIIFDNAGTDDCKIFVNDTDHSHDGDYFYLQAGKAVTFGNMIDCVDQDFYDIVFLAAAGATKRINIIRETFQLLT